MIIVCKCCAGTGEVRAFNLALQEIQRECPVCKGAGKKRGGEVFTALKYIAMPILQDMSQVAPWIVVDEANGRIMFHEGPGIPEDDEELLKLLRLSGRIAAHMESHNWLVAL